MPELTPQDFANSFSDDADLEAVKYYLSIGDDYTQLRVSTAMYARAGSDNPDKITKDAEELRLGSIGTASRLRQALLLGMNQNTLQELATLLLDHDKLFEYAYISGRQDSFEDLEKNDPIRGPVFAMIRQRGLLPNPPDLITGEKLKAASAGTEVHRPDLPCELEAALRWAADAPHAPIKPLSRAFADWTITITEIVDTDTFKHRISEYNRKIKDLRTDSVRAGILRDSIKSDRETISRSKLVASYKSSFQPGKTKPSKKLAAHVKNLLNRHFGTPPEVSLEQHLSLFATYFRPFWKEHGAAYQRLAKIKSKTNKRSGERGPISRMKLIWEARTASFIRFSEGRQIPEIGSDEWDIFFEAFSRSQPEQRRTQKIIAGFMRTLLSQAAQPITIDLIDSLVKKMKVEKIKAVDSATISSCLEKLKSVTDSSST